MLLTILVILLICSLLGGGLAHSRYGYLGWSPTGALVAAVVIVLLLGNRL